jgi:hypothetical protein
VVTDLATAARLAGVEPWQRVVDDCRRFALVLTKSERRFLAFLAEIKHIEPKDHARLRRIARKLRALGH